MAEQTRNNEQNEQQDLSQILQVRREKLKALQDEGHDPFHITKYDVTHHAQEIKDSFDVLEGTEVHVAGRLMSKRGMGKVSFCDLQDKSGRIQIYARKDEMDEAVYNAFKKCDIGDIVGVRGDVFRTQKGEMSVRAHDITLLSKSCMDAAQVCQLIGAHKHLMVPAALAQIVQCRQLTLLPAFFFILAVLRHQFRHVGRKRLLQLLAGDFRVLDGAM